MSSILLTDIIPLRERGIWQGYLNIIFGAGTATGAPLGGLVAESLGWRWYAVARHFRSGWRDEAEVRNGLTPPSLPRSFIGQVPLLGAAFLAAYFGLDLPTLDSSHVRDKLARIDFLGAFFLVSAVLCLLIGLDNGSNTGWNKLYTIVPLATSPALFAIFILVETKVASHPFAPRHIIFERSVQVFSFIHVRAQQEPMDPSEKPARSLI